ADDGVEALVDAAGHHRHHAAAGADVEVGAARAEGVARQQRRVCDAHVERGLRIRGPHAAVLDAEREAAGACRDLGRIRLPAQLETHVAAVAAAFDQHGAALYFLAFSAADWMPACTSA